MQYPWPSWRFTVKKDGGWEPSEKVVSKRKASKTELDEDRKRRETEVKENRAHLIAKTNQGRTEYSETLKRDATPFEIAYIEFAQQCAVADFNKVERPSPPPEISARYSSEQMPEILEMIGTSTYYNAKRGRLQYENGKKRKAKRKLNEH